jgi:hypothetical protein
MSFIISNNEVAHEFNKGKKHIKHSVESTGDKLFYHGNLIAEYKDGALYISNGGYVPNSEYTGSLSTKFILNGLTGVRIDQKLKKWYLNGKEWDGEFIKVKGVKAPKVIEGGKSKQISLRKKYVRTDGWRGYEEPEFAVAGANDTGTWSDSPCPSHVATEELGKARAVLSKEGIKVKEIVTQSSNVFCVHRYLVASEYDNERAKELLKPLKDETRLLYIP